MYLYTVTEAIIAVAAGLFIALRTPKNADIVYNRMDKAGIITNLLLLIAYVCLSPLYLFLGMISTPRHDGFLGAMGWIFCIVIASAALFCYIGLGLSVAWRRKGKSRQSFIVQFAGLVGIGLCVGLYSLLAGNLIRYLN